MSRLAVTEDEQLAEFVANVAAHREQLRAAEKALDDFRQHLHERRKEQREALKGTLPHFSPASDDGRQRIFTFPNGYGASVVRDAHTYGGSSGLWELAVMTKDGSNYDTPVTSDVEGWLDEDAVQVLLHEIAALPPYGGR